MIPWNKAPFFKLLFPLMIGIIIGMFFPQPNFIAECFFLAFLFIVLALFSFKKIEYKFWKGVFISVSLLLIGIVIVTINQLKWNQNYYEKSLNKESVVWVKIQEPTVEKHQSFKTIGEVIFVSQKKITRKVCGKVVLYFQKCEAAKSLNYGDVVIMKNKFQDLKDAPNPNEFSPKEYLRYRAIYQSGYLHKNDWKLAAFRKGNPITLFCYKARSYCLEVLRKNELEGDEFAVASAMIVGFEDELKPEIISFFSASGAMHLLSVSGLHIAFVYAILRFLLKPLQRIKRGNIIELFISIFTLWFYAIITGFSPPVLRSALMFSIVVYGNTFEKYLNMYNILAIAAFVLLLYEPLSIADVGFQLSFLALLSILLIQPIISELFYSKNWFLQKAWEITSVSISATIGTLPFTFFYFHQFPNYFLAVNLLVIPLSTLLLYTGFTIVLLSWIPSLSWILTKLLYYFTFALNRILKFDETLPGSVWHNIQFNVIETILLIITIGFFVLYLHQRNEKQLYLMCTFMFLFVFSTSVFYLPHRNQKSLVIYSIKGHTAIEFFNGTKSYFVADSSLLKNEIDLKYHVYPNRIKNYIGTVRNIEIQENYTAKSFVKKKNYLQFDKTRITILDSKLNGFSISKKLKIDYLVLTNGFEGNLASLNKKYLFKKIIVDTSVPSKFRNKLKFDCKKNDVEYWDISRNGGFVASL